jgi:hypothetical protein
MAKRSSSASRSEKPSQGGRATQQKQRAEGERGRASGGGLRGQPIEEPAGRSASTGGRATRASVRGNANSRSSKKG